MRRALALTPVLVCALVLAAAAPAGALAPFPAGDDDIRAFVELPGATCGASIATTAQVVHYENIPVGAEYYVRYYENGVRMEEDGPYPPPGTGTGTANYAGFSFGSGSYPRSVGMVVRIDVGGEPTYLGGTVIFCPSLGAPAESQEFEDFFPPCGVGDHPPFPDVPASSQFCDDVAWAEDVGITTGYPDGGFHPTAPVTRQAMAAFLFRWVNRWLGAKPCLSAPFSDVGTAHPFCGEIEWVADEGIADGYPDGTFRPPSLVTRQAMAAFLYRAAGEPDGADPTCSSAPFPDVPTGHPFCGEIAWMDDEGISTGYADGTFRPGAAVSRQATVAFLHRLDDLTSAV